jgi:hypothetical protein
MSVGRPFLDRAGFTDSRASGRVILIQGQIEFAILEHIQKAMTLAQEVFNGHEVQMSGALSEEMTCDKFQCLTWK